MTFYDILREIGQDGKIVTPDGKFCEKMMAVPYTVRENGDDTQMSELGFADDERLLLIMGGDAPQFDRLFSYIELDGREYEILSQRRFQVEGRAEHTECVIRERQAMRGE